MTHLCLVRFSVLHLAFVFVLSSSLSFFSLPLLYYYFFFFSVLFCLLCFLELGFSFCLGLFTFFPAVQQTTDRIGNRALVGAQ